MAAKEISGPAVIMAALGGYLVYAGVNDVPFLGGLRELAKGRVPKPAGDKPTPGEVRRVIGDWYKGGKQPAPGESFTQPGAGNGGIADAALSYLGVPYKWAGHDPKTGFDCSGLVTYVLAHDLGIATPSKTHTVTGQFLVWGGATSIPSSQCARGDLVCWPGHIGIATSPTTMIHAPTFGDVVRESKIWWAPAPVIRRVKW